MANKSKLRLLQVHYDTAKELRYIHQPPKDWPHPPRSIRQRASLYLNRLAKDAGIGRAGLTAEDIYLKAVRAIVATTGADADWSARQLQGIAAEWEKRRRELWNQERSGTKGTSERKKTLNVVEGWGRRLAAFGILGGDQLEVEAADAPRPGEVLLLWDGKESWEIGRFVRYDGGEALDEIVLDQAEGRYGIELAGLTTYRPLRVTRRFEAPEDPASGDGLSPEARRRVETLRRRLDRLTSNDEESERFRVEREIYDLTRGAVCAEDEWPDTVAA